jgi:hypothetical protein
MGVPLRDVWNVQPERLSPVWTLHKSRKSAECILWSHHFGLIQSQGVRSTEEIVSVQEEWRAAMRAGLRRRVRVNGRRPDTPDEACASRTPPVSA